MKECKPSFHNIRIPLEYPIDSIVSNALKGKLSTISLIWNRASLVSVIMIIIGSWSLTNELVNVAAKTLAGYPPSVPK